MRGVNRRLHPRSDYCFCGEAASLSNRRRTRARAPARADSMWRDCIEALQNYNLYRAAEYAILMLSPMGRQTTET